MWLITALSLALSLTGSPKLVAQGATKAQSAEKFEVEIKKKVSGSFLLALPKDYGKDSGKRYPLVIFLHGAGERGSDLEVVKKHGPPKLVAAGKDFPFILVSPQCPEGTFWSLDVLNGLYKRVCKQYAVDKDRVYLTGLSMGGYGTWAWATDSPDKFAAIAPICGGGDPQTVSKIKDIPTWVFHGAKDTAVPIQQSERMVSALKALGSSVKFTVYPEAGHDSWTETYDNPEFFTWLLQQTRVKK